MEIRCERAEVADAGAGALGGKLAKEGVGAAGELMEHMK
jgi:hypothetical protein